MPSIISCKMTRATSIRYGCEHKLAIYKYRNNTEELFLPNQPIDELHLQRSTSRRSRDLWRLKGFPVGSLGPPKTGVKMHIDELSNAIGPQNQITPLKLLRFLNFFPPSFFSIKFKRSAFESQSPLYDHSIKKKRS